MHCHNASEQAMRTLKDHLISGLFSVNPNTPLKLWYSILNQATSTMNLMRKLIINQNISSNEKLFGILNFNHTPFAPTGTRIMVRKNPENRATYAPHGSHEWYIGRSLLNYRLLNVTWLWCLSSNI